MNITPEVELAQIHKRTQARKVIETRDFTRRRELIRELQRAGHTWDRIMELAHVSRTTVRDALREG